MRKKLKNTFPEFVIYQSIYNFIVMMDYLYTPPEKNCSNATHDCVKKYTTFIMACTVSCIISCFLAFFAIIFTIVVIVERALESERKIVSPIIGLLMCLTHIINNIFIVIVLANVNNPFHRRDEITNIFNIIYCAIVNCFNTLKIITGIIIGCYIGYSGRRHNIFAI